MRIRLGFHPSDPSNPKIFFVQSMRTKESTFWDWGKGHHLVRSTSNTSTAPSADKLWEGVTTSTIPFEQRKNQFSLSIKSPPFPQMGSLSWSRGLWKQRSIPKEQRRKRPISPEEMGEGGGERVWKAIGNGLLPLPPPHLCSYSIHNCMRMADHHVGLGIKAYG